MIESNLKIMGPVDVCGGLTETYMVLVVKIFYVLIYHPDDCISLELFVIEPEVNGIIGTVGPLNMDPWTAGVSGELIGTMISNVTFLENQLFSVWSVYFSLETKSVCSYSVSSKKTHWQRL